MWKITEGGANEREMATSEMMGWDVMKFFGTLDKHLAHVEFLEKQAKAAEAKARAKTQKAPRIPSGKTRRK